MVHSFPSPLATSFKAAIFGLSGPVLTPEELRFFQRENPLGFILFARNCENPAQVRALTDSLREALGRACPILIDQEGGRVCRLKPPHWKAIPAMKNFGDRMRTDPQGAEAALRDAIAEICAELVAAGVTVDCAPILDVLRPETHDIIGDRAFSDDPGIVARLGMVACEAFLEGGIVPVIKHIPGHGRARADSHKELPIVSSAQKDLEHIDFYPFSMVSAAPFSKKIWAMTAHVLYSELDGQHCASVSKNIIENIIRKKIGFSAILLSDDLGMEALAPLGDYGQRARAVLEAGCDLALHCSGNMDEMIEIADKIGPMTAESLARLSPAFLGQRSAA